MVSVSIRQKLQAAHLYRSVRTPVAVEVPAAEAEDGKSYNKILRMLAYVGFFL